MWIYVNGELKAASAVERLSGAKNLVGPGISTDGGFNSTPCAAKLHLSIYIWFHKLGKKGTYIYIDIK